MCVFVCVFACTCVLPSVCCCGKTFCLCSAAVCRRVGWWHRQTSVCVFVCVYSVTKIHPADMTANSFTCFLSLPISMWGWRSRIWRSSCRGRRQKGDIFTGNNDQYDVLSFTDSLVILKMFKVMFRVVIPVEWWKSGSEQWHFIKSEHEVR